ARGERELSQYGDIEVVYMFGSRPAVSVVDFKSLARIIKLGLKTKKTDHGDLQEYTQIEVGQCAVAVSVKAIAHVHIGNIKPTFNAELDRSLCVSHGKRHTGDKHK